MSAAGVDSASVLALGTGLAALLVIVLRRWPRAAMLAWLAVVWFVPVWMTITIRVGIVPTAATGLIVLAAIVPVSVGRVVWGDLAFAALMLSCLFPALLGLGTIATFAVVTLEWGLGYVLGRLAPRLLGLDQVYRWIAWMSTVAAIGAIAESITRVNIFAGLAWPGPAYQLWSQQLTRGGVLRVDWALGHPIALGACLAVSLPLILASSIRVPVRLTMAILVFTATVLTFSRAAIITAVLALVLSLILLPATLPRRLRGWLIGAFGLGIVVAAPIVATVFADAGNEAEGSAEYRVDLLALLPEVAPIGFSDAITQSPSGETLTGTFASIDSAWLLLGLHYGALALIVGTLAYLATAFTLLRRATAPTIAVVAAAPIVLTVAFITQFGTWFWFVAGLAAASHAMRTSGAPTTDHQFTHRDGEPEPARQLNEVGA